MGDKRSLGTEKSSVKKGVSDVVSLQQGTPQGQQRVKRKKKRSPLLTAPMIDKSEKVGKKEVNILGEKNKTIKIKNKTIVTIDVTEVKKCEKRITGDGKGK